MEFNAGFVVHGIFDDSQKTLVGTLADTDRLTDQFVASKGCPRGRHSTRVAIRTCVEGRVDTAKIWTLCLSTTALCCHCDDVVAANHEDTLVLDQVAVSHEESPPVDVEDFALSTFTAVFLDIVVVSDLGTVAVCCYSVLVPVDHLRYLGVEECANVALLIDYTQDFAIDSNDTTNS
jgi:hypothetical protein